MVEKAHSGERHYHVVFVAAVDDSVVTNGAAGFGDIFYAALFGALDVVAEGEESVGACLLYTSPSPRDS